VLRVMGSPWELLPTSRSVISSSSPLLRNVVMLGCAPGGAGHLHAMRMTRPPAVEEEPVMSKELSWEDQAVFQELLSKIGKPGIEQTGIYVEGYGVIPMSDIELAPGFKHLQGQHPPPTPSTLTVEDIQEALRENPILAHTINASTGQDLLRSIIENMDPYTNAGAKTDILKRLINENPYALFSPSLPDNIDATSVRAIARFYPEILSWIAKQHTWVLYDARSGLLDPGSPLNSLPAAYAEGWINAQEVKTFYERFPVALSFQGWFERCSIPSFPLQIMLHRLFYATWSPTGEDEELMKFLVRKDPSILQLRVAGEVTSSLTDLPLNSLCGNLNGLYWRAVDLNNANAEITGASLLKELGKITDNAKSVCRLLELVVKHYYSREALLKDINRPNFRYLLTFCHEPPIQDLMVEMLKVNRDCFAFVRQPDPDPTAMETPPYALALCDDMCDLLGREAQFLRELFLLEAAIGARTNNADDDDDEGDKDEEPRSTDGGTINKDDGSQTLGEYTGTLYTAWVQKRARAVQASLKKAYDTMEEKKAACQESAPSLLSKESG
jgi:hypothetical protein